MKYPSSLQPPLHNQDPPLEAKAKVGNDQHQDSKEEIKAIIENEPVCLREENERLDSSKNVWPNEG
jgi:hypothetical protein